MLFASYPKIIFLWSAIIYSSMFFLSQFLSEIKVFQEPKEVEEKLLKESRLVHLINKPELFMKYFFRRFIGS